MDEVGRSTTAGMQEVGQCQEQLPRMPEPRATHGAVAYMDVGEEREQDAEALPRGAGEKQGALKPPLPTLILPRQ